MPQDPLPKNQTSDSQLEQLDLAFDRASTALYLVALVVQGWGNDSARGIHTGTDRELLEELKETVEDLNQRDDNLERLLKDVAEKSMPLNATQRIKDRLQAISRQRQSLANTRSIAESSAKGPLPSEISATLVRIEGKNLRRGLGI
jgi:hypothetical protein